MIMIVTNKKLDKLDIELVEKINNAKTKFMQEKYCDQRKGLLMAAEALGFDAGQMLMNADNYYINQGIDRPMCGGEFLDWKSTEETDDQRPSND